MPRTPPVSTRYPDDVLEGIDRARGPATRAQWLIAAARSALAASSGEHAPSGENAPEQLPPRWATAATARGLTVPELIENAVEHLLAADCQPARGATGGVSRGARGVRRTPRISTSRAAKAGIMPITPAPKAKK